MIRAYAAAFALALSACSGGGQPDQLPQVEASPVALKGTFSEFQTSETVDALAFGMAPAIDSSDAFRGALGTGGRTVMVPAGEYTIGRTVIPSNTILILASGVTLRDSGKLGRAESLLELRGTTNVKIVAHGARLVSPGYSEGEFRHGVLIFGAMNVRIDDLEVTGMGGDGFYIGGAMPSQDIELHGVLADRSRRNGLSIVSGIDVFVSDSEFRNTRGTAPEFGVDIEPNNARDALIGIVLDRVHTPGNRKGGILVFLKSYQDGPVADVLISGHTGGGYSTEFVRPTDRVRYF